MELAQGLTHKLYFSLHSVEMDGIQRLVPLKKAIAPLEVVLWRGVQERDQWQALC